MTNKEALKLIRNMRCSLGDIPREIESPSLLDVRDALELAIQALETLDDVKHTVYRNEWCENKRKCIEYIGYHCAGCSIRENKRMNIDNEDFGTLTVCAIRYCQGRQTYMPSLVQRIVKSHITEISDKDLQVLINDCESQAMWGDYGSDFDKKGWLEYRDFLIAEQNKRNEDKI